MVKRLNELHGHMMTLSREGQPRTLGLETFKIVQDLGARASVRHRNIVAWTELARKFDIRPILADFQEFYRASLAIFAGTEGPDEPPREDDLRAFFWPARLLATKVMRAVSSEPIVHRSILRLRVFLEKYDREALLERMQKKAGDGQNKQNEAVLQRAVDGFLFGEGLFPLTHFELAGGNVDTFFEERLPEALKETKTLALPPALIELKQVVALEGSRAPTEGDVSRAVVSALAQARHYGASLGAEWRAHRVYAVIAYNGDTRYSLRATDDSVVLVYLGNEPPSGRKKTLDLEETVSRQ